MNKILIIICFMLFCSFIKAQSNMDSSALDTTLKELQIIKKESINLSTPRIVVIKRIELEGTNRSKSAVLIRSGLAEGDEIKATASGIVTAAGKAPDYGNYIKIKHGGGIETRYAHASKLLVKKGDLVNKDQVIALVGNTGRSTGPHLHYEIRLNGRSLDPRKYLKKK